jgi:methyltransferase (TIGR00027 family)
MAERLIQDVSDTAFMVATFRAMESARPDALFSDPLAEKLAGSHGEKIAAAVPVRRAFGYWLLAIRTCIIDEFIAAAIAEGADTILNLGAGLDTRPYRMNLPADLAWIEVDCAKIIDLKTEKLADEMPRCRLQRTALDLADAKARKAFFSSVNDQASKVLVLAEGVIPYLRTQDVGSLADDLRGEPSFRYWIVDYLSPQARSQRKRMTKKMKMENAPLQFEPADYLSFFGGHGWRVKEMRYVFEEAQRLNRPLSMPLFYRCWMRLRGMVRPKHQSALLKAIAYVLLEPAPFSSHP